MVEKQTSQTQQEKPATPFEQAATAQVSRMEAYFAELNKLQEKQLKETQTAIDEAAKLMKETASYASRMTAEWQRMTLANARQASSIFGAGWMG